MMTTSRIAPVLAAMLVLAGCGGGGSAPQAAPAPPALAGPTVAGRLVLSFAQPGSAVLARRPMFVSPNAASAGVSVNGGTTAFFDVSATSALCSTPAGGARTCNLA